ncbi:MAG TPA: hypothetical protein VJQ51_04375, partial [Burkholderiales bacterium]|nr:hypothetical protein [Burkholderiales bacterium]
PRSFPPRQKVVAAVNPSWRIEPDSMSQGMILHIRHSGFGWLHFLFPKEECARLGGGLLAWSRKAVASPPERRH